MVLLHFVTSNEEIGSQGQYKSPRPACAASSNGLVVAGDRKMREMGAEGTARQLRGILGADFLFF